jgi:uncharacterized protein (TIGR02391 family)
MSKLLELFPTAESLLELSPQDLAPVLLRLARDRRGTGGMFWPDGVTEIGSPGPISVQNNPYPHHQRMPVEALLNEAWNCLRRDSLIIPAPGMNGKNGYMVLTRDGEEALKGEDGFDRIRAVRSFPKELLHPAISKDAYAALQRSDLATAVRHAFTAVEISVRRAGGFTDDDYGTDLMRRAFHEQTGPLTDRGLSMKAERESFAHLFAGAIGAYKNPHSHREVTIDLREAQRQVLLASHLLHIVDAAVARRSISSP